MPPPSNKQLLLELIQVLAQQFTPPEVPTENRVVMLLPPLMGSIVLGVLTPARKTNSSRHMIRPLPESRLSVKEMQARMPARVTSLPARATSMSAETIMVAKEVTRLAEAILSNVKLLDQFSSVSAVTPGQTVMMTATRPWRGPGT